MDLQEYETASKTTLTLALSTAEKRQAELLSDEATLADKFDHYNQQYRLVRELYGEEYRQHVASGAPVSRGYQLGPMNTKSKRLPTTLKTMLNTYWTGFSKYNTLIQATKDRFRAERALQHLRADIALNQKVIAGIQQKLQPITEVTFLEPGAYHGNESSLWNAMGRVGLVHPGVADDKKREALSALYQRLERSGQLKELPGSQEDSQYRWFQHEAGDLLVLGLANVMTHNIIGGLVLERLAGRIYNTEAIGVLQQHRGEKLGLALYGLAMTVLKLSITTGSGLTPDGQRLWRAIARIPGVHIYGIVATRNLHHVSKVANATQHTEPLQQDSKYVVFPVYREGDFFTSPYFRVADAAGAKLVATHERA